MSIWLYTVFAGQPTFNFGSLCTGNNDFEKDPLRIFKFKEPEVDGNDMTIPSDEIEKLEVRYEDVGYDCEALAGWYLWERTIILLFKPYYGMIFVSWFVCFIHIVNLKLFLLTSVHTLLFSKKCKLCTLEEFQVRTLRKQGNQQTISCHILVYVTKL